MSEDDIYRASTQYRLWSYSPTSLTALRAATNSSAVGRVRAAIERARTTQAAAAAAGPEVPNNDEVGDRDLDAPGIDCLTAAEELKLVSHYCLETVKLADFLALPTNLKATAVQYLKRFYLSNSPMTYHPKSIMPTAIFLATKTENHYIGLKAFAAKLENMTAEDIIAPEFLLTQGLRFTFDVRHPHRGLEGGFMELLALADGAWRGGDAWPAEQRHNAVFALMERGERGEVKTRIRGAHSRAKDLLKGAAMFSDAYFLYSPAQIWLAAVLAVDEDLATFYIVAKKVELAAGRSRGLAAMEQLLRKLRACVEVLQACEAATAASKTEAYEHELAAIEKKLYYCQNPEKLDLVSLNRTQKRQGLAAGEGELDEKVVKKRKLQREQRLDDGGVFGFGAKLINK
ncbi:MAG: hypothetical protein M1829_001734 [Trizodia sp. TS-e1964]|nr:MAG: hypothetical protein M1829_001734 [Trizodia sp. TS-e1964]